jgi:hypothetical protein
MTSYKKSILHDRTAICVFDRRNDPTLHYNSLLYIIMIDQIGETVTRKMAFLETGKNCLLMTHLPSVVQIGATTVLCLRSLSLFRLHFMNPGLGKKFLSSLKRSCLLWGPCSLRLRITTARESTHGGRTAGV